MFWDWMVARLKEPSTYSGLSLLLTGIGLGLAPEYWQALTTIGLGIAGLIEMLRKQGKICAAALAVALTLGSMAGPATLLLARSMVVLALVAGPLVLGGCAVKTIDRPSEAYAAAEISYAEALTLATALAAADKLSRADMEKIEHARRVARAALDQARRILADPALPEADALWWVARGSEAVAALVMIQSTYRARA